MDTDGPRSEHPTVVPSRFHQVSTLALDSGDFEVGQHKKPSQTARDVGANIPKSAVSWDIHFNLSSGIAL